MRDHQTKTIECFPWTIVNSEAGEPVVWSYQVGKASVCIEPPQGGVPREQQRFTSGKHIVPIKEVIGCRRYDEGHTEITAEDVKTYIHRGLRVEMTDILYEEDGLSAQQRDE